MKKLLLLLASVCFSVITYGQCTITNATSCVCVGGATDCDLLPDITISWYALQTYSGGPTEYPQTGAGADNGRLRITGSTPNIGYGPFCVRTPFDTTAAGNFYHYVCGTDTFTSTSAGSFTCPNGAVAKEILYQRIYHKSNNSMTHYDRIAGAMTPGMHVDDWGIMTLRLQDSLIPDPRNWSILGTGHKQSFCLMDYYACGSANGLGHCRDDNTVFNAGNILNNSSFPNFGLGNNYGCDPNEQGCSVGWTDIYNESLNGMWIDIPPNTCNGVYWIVYEIDPHNYFTEMNETNNFTAIPFTLTQQNPPNSNQPIIIATDRVPVLCGNDSITLTSTAGFSYLWSNGATTQSIRTTSGNYFVTVTNYCGTTTSDTFTVANFAAPSLPAVTGDTVCSGTTATLTATGGNITWYNSSNVLVGTGNTFVTPILTSSANYYAQDAIIYPGAVAHHGGRLDSIGAGGYFTGSQYMIFDALKTLTIKSVKVYANGAGNRTIQLMNSSGVVLQSGTFNIPNGSSRVNINFDVPHGTGYHLTVAGATVNLYRNNGGVTYPYTITDTLTVTGSSAGANFYYFFYDWDVEVGGAHCESPPANVAAVVTSCTGISPVLDLSKNFNVYPNPSSGKFTFEIIMPGSGEDLNIRVFDLLGKEIYHSRLKNISGSYTTEIDLSTVSKGIYQLAVEIAGKKYYRKIMIW